MRRTATMRRNIFFRGNNVFKIKLPVKNEGYIENWKSSISTWLDPIKQLLESRKFSLIMHVANDYRKRISYVEISMNY